MTTIKDKALAAWFVISAVALAALYLLVDRRNRTISQLKMEAEKQVLAQKLVGIRQKATQGGENYAKAMEEYRGVKRRHAELLKRFGLFTGGSTDGSSGRGEPGSQ